MFSVKSIYVSIMYNDINLATATGFLITRNNNIYLVTNRHVVTGRNNQTNECLDPNAAIPNKIKAWIPFRENEKYKWIEKTCDLYDKDELPMWFEHPLYQNRVDVVALKLGNLEQNMCYYNTNSFYNPIVTENVFIIGYPFGYNIRTNGEKYAIWTTGTIASDPDLNIEINGEQVPAFLVDAKTRKGQSGSPVIYYNDMGLDKDLNGISLYGGPVWHEIGIYSGRINKESDLGFVWKWSVISEIIQNI